MFDLTGKTILLTGANGLLGTAFNRAMTEAGARVIATDMKELDVTDPDAWDKYTFYQIDALVHCAAYTTNSKWLGHFPKPFFNVSLIDWNATLNTNLTSAFIGCQKVLPGMMERGSGSVILLGSLYASQSPHLDIYEDTGIFQPPAYTVAKHGILGLTRYLAALVGASGVRVNCLSPGGVEQNNTNSLFRERFNALAPMRRMATPDDVCGALLWLVSDASKYVTGQNIQVDGGWSAW